MKHKNKWLYWFIPCMGLLLFGSAYLFSHERLLWKYSRPIDAERFANYGSFISALLSIATVILVYLTFRQTRISLDLNRKNATDSSFFNLFKAHLEIVSTLNSQQNKE